MILYRISKALHLNKTTTVVYNDQQEAAACSCDESPAGGHAYPRLPALDVRLHSEVLCLSWDFMMVSCLCLRSSRMVLNSSSSHRSERTGSDAAVSAQSSLAAPLFALRCSGNATMLRSWLSAQNVARCLADQLMSNQTTELFHQTSIKRREKKAAAADAPMGVSSRQVLALRLAPCDTSSSATSI